MFGLSNKFATLVFLNLTIMARRQIEKDLCREIKDSSFNFIPRGLVSIHTIYELVQQRYPNLCDDDYLCSTHCREGSNQPEWKH